MHPQRIPSSWRVVGLALALCLTFVPAAVTAVAAPVLPHQIHIDGFVFDPLIAAQPLASAVAPDTGPALRLVQFSSRIRDRWLAALGEAGVVALQYYPDDAFLIWADQAGVARLKAHDFIRWTGDFLPAYKTNAGLQGRTGPIRNVSVLFYNDGNVERTLDQLVAQGARVLQSYPAQPGGAFYGAIVVLDASAIDAVSQISTVWWLGYSSPEPGFDDEMSDQIVAGNHPGGAPVTGYSAHLAGLGYGGAGITWAIVDTGIDYDHPDLGPHIVGGYNFPGACTIAGQPGTDCSNGGHGTHVSGIVGGTASLGTKDANGFLYGLGIAPEVGLFAMNSLSAPDWPPQGGWQEHSKRAVLGGAIGGNNSWTTGEGSNHGYQSSERTHDLMVRDGNFDTTTVAEPFIEVFSAGNSGPGSNTLTAPKEAKNLIVTASSKNYRVGNIDDLSSFSSRGPAKDGRIVPTLTAPGEEIASTANDTGGDCSTPISGTNGKYAMCSGTSMASPHTSGAVALVADWWADTRGGAIGSPAMAKAILVNIAVDMGAANIPNFDEGWGRINITNAIAPGVSVRYFDQEEVLADLGQAWTLQTSVADPTKPLKVTLAWTDAPGAVGANPALVNDLNLAVQVNGNTYLGNVFAAGWSTTGGVADALNNLENVYVQAPAGDVTITVTAANLPGDGIPYNADATDQDFALVCYNCTFGPDFTLTAQPREQAVCASASASFDLTVGQVAGFVEPVTLSATGVPAGATASFNTNPVTPPGASVFTVGDTAAAIPGTYPIDITGVATSKTHTTQVKLTIDNAPFPTPVLLTPVANATGQPLSPIFSWQAVPGALSYSFELASDPAFASIVEAVAVNTTTHTSGVLLSPDAEYYWRVSVSNACGATTSLSGRFHTDGIACTTYPSTDVSKSIPRNGSVTSNLTIAGSSTIKDLDVYSLTGNHSSFSDIEFSLKSPANTSVVIMARGCSGNVSWNLNLDDEASASWPCPPTGGGTFKPSNPLSAFDGQGANGTWVLTVADNRPGNGGTLSTWGLNVCTASCTAPVPPTSLGITVLDPATARLSWNEAGAATYEVWYAADTPYFDPIGKTCANPAPYTCSTTAALSFDHASLGNASSSYTYVVRSANSCGAVTASASNRVGEFEFALAPGAN